MLAVGMVFLLAIREIDLSVGWMFNFSAVFAAVLMVAGIDPWLAAALGVTAIHSL
jgi:ribose transport system permease protein